ncbi:MAG: hypothetical protein K1X55_08275 [Chitinophagales bacterium]|nr:hypothetical protein [Chitinophagales bacterium]
MVILFSEHSFSKALTITDSFKAVILENEVTYLRYNGNLSFKEMLKQPAEDFKTLPKSNFNFGFVKDDLWFKISVNNEAQTDKEFILEIVNSYLQHIQVFVIQGDSVYATEVYGNQYPTHKKPISHFNYLLNINLPKGSSTIYFHIRNPNAALIFSLFLWEKSTRIFYMEREKYSLFYYFFFLFFLIGIIISSQILLKSFTYHWFYIISSFLFVFYIFIDTGLFSFLILGHPYKKIVPLLFLVISLYLSFSSLMLHFFFKEGRTFLFFRIFYNVVYICGFVFAILDVFLFLILNVKYPIWLIKLSLSFYVVFIIVIAFNTIIHLIKKIRPFENFAVLFGCIMHFIGILFIIFQSFGVIPKWVINKEDFLQVPFPYTLSTNTFITLGFSIEITIVFMIVMFRLIKSWENNLQITKELAQEKVKNYSSLVTGIEQERERIAQDLHDGLGVILSSIKMKLSNDSNTFHPEKLNSIIKDIDAAHEDVRTISRNLMSKTLTKLGLQSALEEMLNKVKENHPEIEITFFNNSNLKFKETAALNIYRILQELLNNIIKHAIADEITIQLIQHKESLLVMVEDNGIGFNLSERPNGIGLENVKYRVQSMDGTLHVDSSLGRGTSISFELPLTNIVQ